MKPDQTGEMLALSRRNFHGQLQSIFSETMSEQYVNQRNVVPYCQLYNEESLVDEYKKTKRDEKPNAEESEKIKKNEAQNDDGFREINHEKEQSEHGFEKINYEEIEKGIAAKFPSLST
uniref:Uncharacterized protein n=1 Tax=Romanomermis culicivorax TaxID=13658 RepID=A0A915KUQ4_ROMCU